jgi:hypothetical protein
MTDRTFAAYDVDMSHGFPIRGQAWPQFDGAHAADFEAAQAAAERQFNITDYLDVEGGPMGVLVVELDADGDEVREIVVPV